MKILFVCLGNICRSPTAEGVVRAIAEREYSELSLEVDSAGTADFHVGEPPDRRSVAAARRRGYDIAGLRARQVRRDDFTRFDHVLVMDRANLVQIGRYAGEGTARVGLFLPYAGGIEEEVPDPYYGGIEDFDRVVGLCEAAAHGLLSSLRRPE